MLVMVFSYDTVNMTYYAVSQAPVGLLNITYILTAIISKTSIYYNVILIVVRTLNIFKPAYVENKACLVTCIVLYPLFWVIIGILDNVGIYYEVCYKDVCDVMFLWVAFIIPILVMMMCIMIQRYFPSDRSIKQRASPLPLWSLCVLFRRV